MTDSQWLENMEDVLLERRKPVEIYDFCYQMELGMGGDIWRATGIAPNHPTCPGRVYTSTPVKFDEENLLLITSSGRKYKICSFSGDKQKWVDQIKKDIEKGGYEIH